MSLRGFRRSSPGVWYPTSARAAWDRAAVARLKREAAESPLGRARLCAHGRPSEPVHEMLIAMRRGCYVRPHRHLRRLESYHVVDGRAELLEFDARGRVTSRRALGPMGSGLPFYYRSAERRFHMLLVRSPFLVIVETTNGPFAPSQTRVAPWAPEDGEAARAFIRRLSGD